MYFCGFVFGYFGAYLLGAAARNVKDDYKLRFRGDLGMLAGGRLRQPCAAGSHTGLFKLFGDSADILRKQRDNAAAAAVYSLPGTARRAFGIADFALRGRAVQVCRGFLNPVACSDPGEFSLPAGFRRTDCHVLGVTRVLRYPQKPRIGALCVYLGANKVRPYTSFIY